MAKLSQQLDQEKRQPQRQSRTQRVAQAQGLSREKQSFENLKAQAQAKQEELSGATFEEYEQKYNALSPELQQFFSTPKEVMEDKTQRISTTSTC